MPDPFEKLKYYAFTLDPVHIGTGGYRLGRVDNAIVREPGTNLPKIPGSSIAGPARAYTAMHPDINRYPNCAGKGKDDGNSHCGEQDTGCPVCVTYGFSRKSGTSFQGLAQFSDAHILFFPVHSMYGPVWVTSQSALSGIGITIKPVAGEAFKKANQDAPANMNFGWLLLTPDNPGKEDISFSFPAEFQSSFNLIKENIYVLPETLFSRVVNDNLEVRTSVAIDPLTGAAEEGALFTYEAIPRSTVLYFDVVYSNPAYFKIAGQDITYTDIRGAVDKGFGYFESLGIEVGCQ